MRVNSLLVVAMRGALVQDCPDMRELTRALRCRESWAAEIIK